MDDVKMSNVPDIFSELGLRTFMEDLRYQLLYYDVIGTIIHIM
jgi:hypothetical protein